jgi:hypothetical protein
MQSIMGVITEDNKNNVIRKMVDDIGLKTAIQMVGNYYAIEPYLTDVDKVNYIKEKVYELNDGRSINLSVINGDTIHYSEKDGKLQLIEWLGKENVTVKTYYRNGLVGDERVPYEDLPGQIIDELTEILINK